MEVNLDLGLGLTTYVPKSMSELLLKVSETQDESRKLSMLQHYVNGMEAELKKIDVFKREFPLCMLLLNDGIGRLKEEVMGCSKSQNLKQQPGNEEHGDVSGVNNESSDHTRSGWMSPAQVWCNSENQDSVSGHSLIREGHDGRSIYDQNSIQVCSDKKKGRPIMTFNGNSQFPSLSLVPPYPKYDFYYSKISSMQFQYVPQPQQQPQQQQQRQQQPPQQQQQRKQQFRRWKCRRRWSPALHQMFEDVLQRLGGPTGAKPKQVKELMNVDGLTCDEVKSHLQKYRLGLQRPPNSSSAATRGRPRQMNISRHLPNQSSTASTSQSNSPQVPQFVRESAHEDTSTSGGDSMEAVDKNISDGHSWRGGFIFMNQSPVNKSTLETQL